MEITVTIARRNFIRRALRLGTLCNASSAEYNHRTAKTRKTASPCLPVNLLKAP
jgi:hypothetical protein